MSPPRPTAKWEQAPIKRSMPTVISKAYESEFPIAPRIVNGEKVTYERVDPRNPKWFFGRDPRGIAGYFPIEWFTIDEIEMSAFARSDYDATELSVSIGLPVEVERQYGGWLFVRTSRGKRGWIPSECVLQ